MSRRFLDLRPAAAAAAMAIAALVFTGGPVRAAPPTPTATPEELSALLAWRSAAQDMTRAKRGTIDPGVGVEELIKVPIGGIDQYLSIRGSDRRNPVILFLHGGPGEPIMPEAHLFQGPLEAGFTVVQWDQRCAGKTYIANRGVYDCRRADFDLMLSDAEAVVALLRTRLGKSRIAVLGHSWGTMLGVPLAARRPEWISVYIGVGQVTSLREASRLGFEEVLREARARRDLETIRQLETTAVFPTGSDDLLAGRREVVGAMNRYGLSYRGDGTYASYGQSMIDLAMRSPEYTLEDVTYLATGRAMESLHILTDNKDFDLARWGSDYGVPIMLAMGQNDQHTPHALAKAWLDGITAPRKSMRYFMESAHSPFLDEPLVFSRYLLDQVRPIAVANEG